MLQGSEVVENAQIKGTWCAQGDAPPPKTAALGSQALRCARLYQQIRRAKNYALDILPAVKAGPPMFSPEDMQRILSGRYLLTTDARAAAAEPLKELVDRIQHLMPAPDGGDDFFGIGGPGEGLGHLVGLLDEAVDGGLEIDDRSGRRRASIGASTIWRRSLRRR